MPQKANFLDIKYIFLGKKTKMNEAVEEEHERCKRWVECRLVSSLVQTNIGKEFECLCHDENERKHFNASPEYRELIKKLFGMEIEEYLGSTFEADEVQEKDENKKSKDDNETEEEEKPVRKPYK